MYDHGDKISSEGGSQKMWMFLILALFSGASAATVTGPRSVYGKTGESVSVPCSYEPGYELYPKCWCRRFFHFCIAPILCTNDTESWVREGRVSIEDDRTSRTFTVTLWSLVPADAGRYCCKVPKVLWFDPCHATKLIVSAAVPHMTGAGNLAAEPRPGDRSRFAPSAPFPTGFMEPPVLSQLSTTYFLLFLGAKVLVVLALGLGQLFTCYSGGCLGVTSPWWSHMHHSHFATMDEHSWGTFHGTVWNVSHEDTSTTSARPHCTGGMSAMPGR
ncbi:CMRF35-like molecule 2 [Nothoprocta perdicaria]|uniref:CMRF35-like molecule 2 n=1 Tax=Nothoprocta perdicaria TaxID=30464 RepID=UPI000E1C3A5F|nr:CMRF35-like molecule 2 [Nothoprocta perdicaria]